MKLNYLFIALLLIVSLLITPAESNCMQIAENFKCPYKHMQCHNNDSGECECEDGTMCIWKGKEAINDNCPCGGKYKPRTGRRARKASGL